MISSPDHAEQQLGKLITERATEIEARWLERVSAEVVATHIELTHLRDGIPDYLTELARLLASPQAERDGAESWARVARHHGVTRVRFGFDIEQLVREFITLRKVIEEFAIAAHALAASSSTVLADLVEAAIGCAVGAYVETRDYELRRRQAEGIGVLIHELRNPLSSAVWAAALAHEHAVPAQAAALHMLDQGHRRLTELIDRVLLTERLEARRIEPNIVEVRVGELLNLALVAAHKAATDKGLVFDVRADRGLAIWVDVDLTRSALQNLVDNAVKYTDAGRVEVEVEDTEAAWSFHVRDTGPGVSQEDLRTIFEPFRRGSTGKPGTGLGLSITQCAIEAQGGAVHAESNAGHGAHFWFTLPKRR